MLALVQVDGSIREKLRWSVGTESRSYFMTRWRSSRVHARHSLKRHVPGEPGLLEEVVSLISAHEQPWSLIDSPVNHAKDQADDELSQSLIGTSIGRYQVVRLIKRSGMGEVYLARDTHLPREVALKLLPLMFTGDERRLRRFILEAEAASSLNHPNILTIHEIGHIRDVHYIATEFVDGQTLRERLADGQLELKEAVEIAVGVTNALVASHAAGIVHRDIKPENIMIRRDGYVKVLDFGLAKLTERPDVRVDGSSPNISSMDTDPGTFMGTVGYLSPEQAKSLEVDTRSDLFSLGVVLYEMIAGENPFNRDAFSEVISAILTTEPQPLAVACSEDAGFATKGCHPGTRKGQTRSLSTHGRFTHGFESCTSATPAGGAAETNPTGALVANRHWCGDGSQRSRCSV